MPSICSRRAARRSKPHTPGSARHGAGAARRTDAALAELEQAREELTRLDARLELAAADAVRQWLAPAAKSHVFDPAGLTGRELEVLRLISGGLSNQAIGERLCISEHTVHRHVANTLSKLGVPSRSAAVAHAAKLGLL